MDLLKLVRDKMSRLPKTYDLTGLNAVLAHLEIAERHLTYGSKSGEDYLFTDVIYRSNQAFEGGLKEGYRTIAGKDADRVTIHEIERHLTSNGVLAERVVSLISNYRREWRNPSTHDYKIEFEEDEALLAVVNVSAFVCILLDQVSEKCAKDAESEKLASVSSPPKGSKTEKAPLSFAQLIADRLTSFSAYISTSARYSDMREVEVLGRLTAYIEAIGDVTVEREPVISSKDNVKLRPDLIVERNGEKVIVEVKRALNRNAGRAAEDQVLTYLRFGNVNTGILYVCPTGKAEKTITDYVELSIAGKNFTLIKILSESSRRSK